MRNIIQLLALSWLLTVDSFEPARFESGDVFLTQPLMTAGGGEVLLELDVSSFGEVTGVIPHEPGGCDRGGSRGGRQSHVEQGGPIRGGPGFRSHECGERVAVSAGAPERKGGFLRRLHRVWISRAGGFRRGSRADWSDSFLEERNQRSAPVNPGDGLGEELRCI
jgi:hypothetical protein